MRIALINNGTNEPRSLLNLLTGNDVTEFSLEDAGSAFCGKYDLFVLSGSSRFPIMYNLDVLEPELALIRNCSTPLLGICFGAELLAVAYGGTLKDTGVKRKGLERVHTTVDHPLFGSMRAFDAFVAHRWIIDTIPDTLEILAHSETGPEIIRHRTKPQYGFQFHPERLPDETCGDELFASLIDHLGLR